jgi:hypothetical protein
VLVFTGCNDGPSTRPLSVTQPRQYCGYHNPETPGVDSIKTGALSALARLVVVVSSFVNVIGKSNIFQHSTYADPSMSVSIILS